VKKNVDVILATRNRGKIREIKDLLTDLPVRILSLEDLCPELELAEESKSYMENARKKAITVARKTRLISLSDDSGLEVEALGGEPGVYSARYFGPGLSDRDKVSKLLRNLQGRRDRRARFTCFICLAFPDGRVQSFDATCEGTIALEPRGEQGFGYDPVFVPEGYERTFAELGEPVKKKISHRARALVKLRSFLEEYLSEANHQSKDR
jgi:XTP/dITP diphosphohydrolase